MKTYTLIFFFVTGFLFSNAQVNSVNNKSLLFASDAIIQNKPSDNQRHPRIAAAYNGWLYTAYTINDTSTKRGGIYVSYSKDNGQTWAKLLTYQFNNSFYRYTDIAVGGSDTSNLCVFVAGTLLDLSNGTSTIYMDKFDGTTGDLLSGQIYVRTLGLLSITDMAVFCDNTAPSSLSSPYSVSILYAVHGGIQDSLFFVSSVNGGQTFGIRNVIAHTSGAFRHVALGYGKSLAVSEGAYFATWEMLNASGNTLGHIYTSHTRLNIGDGWNTPLCLDSLSPSTIGLCRNPAITCQLGSVNNDYSDLSVIVCYERASGGNMADMDIVGSCGRKAYSSNSWVPFVVAGSTENDIEPALSFNPGSNRFLLTYFDSTNAQLPYAVQDFNMGSLNSWSYLSNQYNDLRTNLKAPFPCITVNPQLQEACFTWVGESSGNGNGIIYFDAEYAGLATGIASTSLNGQRIGNAYPNPARDLLQVPYTAAENLRMNVIIYDMLGNAVSAQEQMTLNPGDGIFSLPVGGLDNGIYFCRILIGSSTQTVRFVVQH